MPSYQRRQSSNRFSKAKPAILFSIVRLYLFSFVLKHELITCRTHMPALLQKLKYRSSVTAGTRLHHGQHCWVTLVVSGHKGRSWLVTLYWYLRLLGLQGGNHSWMQQDCLAADHSSVCLGSLGGPSEPWSSGSYHPCLASGVRTQRPVLHSQAMICTRAAWLLGIASDKLLFPWL